MGWHGAVSSAAQVSYSPVACHRNEVAMEQKADCSGEDQYMRDDELVEERHPEFTHQQLHDLIDLAVQDIAGRTGRRVDFFDEVASAIKHAFPACPADCEIKLVS